MLHQRQHIQAVELEVEDVTTFTPETVESGVHNPYVTFVNPTTSEPITVKVELVLDFGASVDPLYNGTHTLTLLDDTIVAAGIVLPLTLSGSFMDQAADITTRHVITLTSPDTNEETNVVYLLFGGLVDETVRTSLNQFIALDGV